jgi:hypothetical protein
MTQSLGITSIDTNSPERSRNDFYLFASARMTDCISFAHTAGTSEEESAKTLGYNPVTEIEDPTMRRLRGNRVR